ncbi:PREDICTED: uncharacterized protein LOC109129618 [Camelina sativa]|uniref:Uncharacterized protein LOC109129618 n=1 Tax=Camelina sativa TaxID=90675 RepID=A0ABM1R3P4_CAMSA|nr:PREDICTED: uncharacterized protein LOC109129618 [Camelina sativa]
MTLSKRRRGNTEGRNLTEKRRRTDINAKIKTLKELTRCTEKKDLVSSLDCIISNITEMKQYVEGFYYPPPMVPPTGMGMDYRPGPWMYPYNYVHPQYMMPYNYNPYVYGQATGYGNEMVPAAAVPTNQGVNYEPETANPM